MDDTQVKKKLEEENDEGSQCPVPEIGSKNSAFQPYAKSLTILTNLQRGNVKTFNKDVAPQFLTFHERAARGDLKDDEIDDMNVNKVDDKGISPLMWASFHGRLAIVQLLLSKGAEIDLHCVESGESALMFAASQGHAEVVRFLLSKGAEVNFSDDYGNSALMYAVNGNHVDCVNELLSSGASINQSNGIGETPFWISVNNGLTASQYAMERSLKVSLEASISTK